MGTSPRCNHFLIIFPLFPDTSSSNLCYTIRIPRSTCFFPFFHGDGTNRSVCILFLLSFFTIANGSQPQHSMLTFLSQKRQRAPNPLPFLFFLWIIINNAHQSGTEYSYFLNILTDFLCYNRATVEVRFFFLFFTSQLTIRSCFLPYFLGRMCLNFPEQYATWKTAAGLSRRRLSVFSETWAAQSHLLGNFS